MDKTLFELPDSDRYEFDYQALSVHPYGPDVRKRRVWVAAGLFFAPLLLALLMWDLTPVYLIALVMTLPIGAFALGEALDRRSCRVDMEGVRVENNGKVEQAFDWSSVGRAKFEGGLVLWPEVGPRIGELRWPPGGLDVIKVCLRILERRGAIITKRTPQTLSAELFLRRLGLAHDHATFEYLSRMRKFNLSSSILTGYGLAAISFIAACVIPFWKEHGHFLARNLGVGLALIVLSVIAFLYQRQSLAAMSKLLPGRVDRFLFDEGDVWIEREGERQHATVVGWPSEKPMALEQASLERYRLQVVMDSGEVRWYNPSIMVEVS